MTVRETMDTTHTPGPWKVGKHLHTRRLTADNAVEVQDARGYMVAMLFTANRGMDGVEDAANARLIAAAPELYAALKALMAEPYGCPFCDSGKLRMPNNPAKDHEVDCGFALARAALAHAEAGEQP